MDRIRGAVEPGFEHVREAFASGHRDGNGATRLVVDLRPPGAACQYHRALAHGFLPGEVLLRATGRSPGQPVAVGDVRTEMSWHLAAGVEPRWLPWTSAPHEAPERPTR